MDRVTPDMVIDDVEVGLGPECETEGCAYPPEVEGWRFRPAWPPPARGGDPAGRLAALRLRDFERRRREQEARDEFARLTHEAGVEARALEESLAGLNGLGVPGGELDVTARFGDDGWPWVSVDVLSLGGKPPKPLVRFRRGPGGLEVCGATPGRAGVTRDEAVDLALTLVEDAVGG